MMRKLSERIIRIVSGRLRNKLSFAFSLIVVFIVVSLSYLSFRQTVQINEQNFIVSNHKLLKLVNQNLDSYIGQIDELSLSPRKDAQFIDALYSSEYLAQFTIQNQLKRLFYSREDIEKIDIYTPRDKLLYHISRSEVNFSQRKDEQTEQSAWYVDAARSPNFRSIESAASGDGRASRQLLTFHRIIINIADKTPLAAVSITLNFHEFDKIISDLSENEQDAIGIFNDKQQPVYLSGGEFAELDRAGGLSRYFTAGGEAENATVRIGQADYMMIYHTSAVNRWTLMKLTPRSVLNKDAANARKINLAIGSGFVVFTIAVIMYVANAITRRLKNFSRRIEQLGEGNFELDSEFEGTDEIAHLSRKFNQMVVRINDLIADRYEITLNERNARLKALEAQINPHFLYNSLQAISTEAIMNDMDSIHQMVDALASSLRYCIRDGETVSLADELEHISNYLILQHARFGSRLNVVSEIEEPALDCMIPKMSLQILLENAIEHALEQMSEAIHIAIRGFVRQDRVFLLVTDDGPGITPERMEQIMAGLDDHYLQYREHMGLNNLYSRIKLLFGAEASFTLRSRPHLGTEAEIALPVRMEASHV